MKSRRVTGRKCFKINVKTGTCEHDNSFREGALEEDLIEETGICEDLRDVKSRIWVVVGEMNF